MRILTFTTLYPNAEQPAHGVFVEHRLRHLVQSGKLEARVVAPIPWFPFKGARFGRYGTFARAPQRELRHGIEVLHPRYPVIPKVGMTVAPMLIVSALYHVLRRIIANGYDFDLIDAHYFYPDGVAAVALGKLFKKPVVITARGTDVHFIPKFRLPRKMIQWTAGHASACITVCEALRKTLIELGAPQDKVHTLRNGVDLELFCPVDRVEARSTIGGFERMLVFVGHLVELKGHHIAIQALEDIPDAHLFIIGEGEERISLVQLAGSRGVAERVHFVGQVEQAALKTYYSAADALILASSREGWANVLLEAMACGTPVIATNVWGTPEVVAAPEAGVLMGSRTPAGLVEAYHRLFSAYPDRSDTRRYAEQFSWNETTEGQLSLFNEVIQAADPATILHRAD